jgi:hypothetical protein
LNGNTLNYPGCSHLPSGRLVSRMKNFWTQ